MTGLRAGTVEQASTSGDPDGQRESGDQWTPDRPRPNDFALIDPLIVEGQRKGGIAQGIGQALLEGFVYDETGNPLTTSLIDSGPRLLAR